MAIVRSMGELREYAEAEPEIAALLNDLSLSRQKTVKELANKQVIHVTEKVVRNYREKYVPRLNEDNVISLTESVPYSYEYLVRAKEQHPSADRPVSLSFTPVENGAVSFKEYYEIVDDVPTVDSLISPFQAPVVKEGKARSSKTIVIMPDLQAPLHDRDLLDKFVDFLDDFQPSELAQTGDFTDSTEISRWVRGKKPEFAGDLQGGFDSAMDVLDLIRQVFDGRFRIVRSNHDDRLELYIEGCGPGLNFRDLTFEKQMHFVDFDVEFIRDGVVELTEDWIMGHGDEGSMSPQAGKTAFGLAKNKFGVNVVCGHTHRAGITTESYGYNGSIKRTLTGLEVGHFMDMKVADYLKKAGGHANWQQAFGVLETINGKTFPTLIPVHQGNFAFEGQMY